VVLPVQERGDQAHGAHIERAIQKLVEDQREPARRPDGLDDVVGRVLGQTQLFPAVSEERAKAGGEVDAPRLQLREVDDQRDRRLARALGVALDFGDQFAVGQSGGGGSIHGYQYHGPL